MIPLSLAQRAQARVIEHELRVRLGPGAPTTVQLESGHPPAALLTARTFPIGVLERRLRFLRAMGWYPESPRVFSEEVGAHLPPEASLEDEIAILSEAAEIRITDPDLRAVCDAVRLARSRISPPPSREISSLEAFFDAVADQIDPDWRAQAGRVTAIPPNWSRLEAATIHADWWFGRRRTGRTWRFLHRFVTEVGNQKRRRWR